MDKNVVTSSQLRETEKTIRQRLRPEARVIYDTGRKVGEAVMGEEVQKMMEDRDYWQYKATHDELTELLNRRGIEIEYRKIVAEHPDPTILAVAVIDVDRLKHFNDTFGHDAGDKYLVFFGHFLASKLHRQADVIARGIVGRTGGDEFLGTVDLSPGQRRDIRLTPELRKHNFKLWLNDAFEKATESEEWLHGAAGFSIGMAFYEEGKSLDELKKLADEDMYAHKQTRGKSR